MLHKFSRFCLRAPALLLMLGRKKKTFNFKQGITAGLSIRLEVGIWPYHSRQHNICWQTWHEVAGDSMTPSRRSSGGSWLLLKALQTVWTPLDNNSQNVLAWYTPPPPNFSFKSADNLLGPLPNGQLRIEKLTCQTEKSVCIRGKESFDLCIFYFKSSWNKQLQPTNSNGTYYSLEHHAAL